MPPTPRSKTSMRALLVGPENPHFVGHLRTLQTLDEIESITLAACVPDDWAKLQSARDEFPHKVIESFPTLPEALRKRFDLAIACPRNDRAREVCLALIAARIPLLIEKPMGRTSDDVAAIHSAAQAARVPVGVFYTNRAHPVIQAARMFVANGLLGELMHVEMRYFTTQIRFRDPEHWLFRRELAGGGVLSWLGCHFIDLAYYISGQEILRASGVVATRSDPKTDVEDVATVYLCFESGAIGSLDCGYVLAQSGGGFYNRAGNDTHFALIGTLGRIWWSLTPNPCVLCMESVHPTWCASPQREAKFILAESPAYGDRYGEEFVRAFLRGEPYATSADALRVARLIEQVYAANQSR